MLPAHGLAAAARHVRRLLHSAGSCSCSSCTPCPTTLSVQSLRARDRWLKRQQTAGDGHAGVSNCGGFWRRTRRGGRCAPGHLPGHDRSVNAHGPMRTSPAHCRLQFALRHATELWTTLRGAARRRARALLAGVLPASSQRCPTCAQGLQTFLSTLVNTLLPKCIDNAYSKSHEGWSIERVSHTQTETTSEESCAGTHAFFFFDVTSISSQGCVFLLLLTC